MITQDEKKKKKNYIGSREEGTSYNLFQKIAILKLISSNFLNIFKEKWNYNYVIEMMNTSLHNTFINLAEIQLKL